LENIKKKLKKIFKGSQRSEDLVSSWNNPLVVKFIVRAGANNVSWVTNMLIEILL
jgi:hypothetical protein